MRAAFETILTTSFHGSIVILAVLLLRLALRKAPKKYICMLWVLAGLRLLLLLPIPLESGFSLQPPRIAISLPAGTEKVLAFVWAAMAGAIGIASVVSYFHLRRQVREAVKVPGGWESDRIETAFVLGFVKPEIYIPAGISGQARQQILAHERTHLDKGDHWIKMLGFLALAVHWFNPLVWVSYVLLCKDIEMACDERVVRFMDLGERKAYSTALLQCSTRRPHYAACPVAFGEVSVKYRIKSILNYRKPSFWICLLAMAAFVFVAVCLLTSPKTVVEVPVDADAPLRQMSQEDPANFTTPVLPAVEPNPDWGVTVILDATSPTGGKLVYLVEERFAAASDTIVLHDATLERWNGTSWEPLPAKSGKSTLFEEYSIGFAQSRRYAVEALPLEDLDWALIYGALPAGDYRLCQTIDSTTDSATFRTPFHIYREALPSDQEEALKRCDTALTELAQSTYYSVLLSETGPDGGIYPVKRVTKNNGCRVDSYVGDCLISSGSGDGAEHFARGWDADFRLDQNRQFLFPDGQAVIREDEITFCSAWADYAGTVYRGTDTYRFQEDGKLRSAERTVQTVDQSGAVMDTVVRRLERVSPEASTENLYQTGDAWDAVEESPWGIAFRVDDDLLSPTGGEVWLGTQAVGVSNHTTDGTYWLEKRDGTVWRRLGGEGTQASWGEESICLTSRTEIRQVDWTATYGHLDAGVYRMGKRFWSGEESTIQYAEFAIYREGGVYGEGGQEALDRVDAAIARLQSGSYRVEHYESSYSSYLPGENLTEIYWKYGDTEVQDFYNKAGAYSHSYVTGPDGFGYGDWLRRNIFESAYDSVYFPQGYGIISDREIQLVYSISQDSPDNPAELYTYRFDEAGNLTEIRRESMNSMWEGYVNRYVVTETPESEIQSWVAEKQAAQNSAK